MVWPCMDWLLSNSVLSLHASEVIRPKAMLVPRREKQLRTGPYGTFVRKPREISTRRRSKAKEKPGANRRTHSIPRRDPPPGDRGHRPERDVGSHSVTFVHASAARRQGSRDVDSWVAGSRPGLVRSKCRPRFGPERSESAVGTFYAVLFVSCLALRETHARNESRSPADA